MFLLYMFVLASYGCYITHNISSMGKFSNIYHNLEYQTALSSHTMSCVENAQTQTVFGRTSFQVGGFQPPYQSNFDSNVQINKLNEEYVDDYTSSGDIFGGDDGNGGSGTEGGNGEGSDYFRPDELTKGRFVKNIEYSYRGMDLHPKNINQKEITRADLYQNMEKKRILNTLESIRVPIPNKLQLCDYAKKQYSDSCSGVYRHNLLGGGLLNDDEWEF